MSVAAWSTERERGSAAWLAAMRWAVTTLGAPIGRLLLLPIVLWFLLSSPGARAASRDYLSRVLGRPAGLWDVGQHFHVFARSILDRGLLLLGRTDARAMVVEGIPHIEAALAHGRGCLLLGAHLGGFEALRAVGQQAPARVRPMMYRDNAGALTALMDRLAPGLLADVIALGRPSAMLEAQEAVARGEIVGMLADRGHASAGRRVKVPFLGAPAAFPAGPFALAHALGAPVLLFRAVRTQNGRWLVQFEPFADRIVLRRGPDRARDLQAYVGRYAAALEQACRAHPYQWFNFYPFWEHADAGPPLVHGDAANSGRGVGADARRAGPDDGAGGRAGAAGVVS